jgi:ketosteroid isomerase-like protein
MRSQPVGSQGDEALSVLENVQVVKHAYDAVTRGDLPGLLGLMTEDVEIHVPGPSAIPFAGTYRGHEGVGRYAADLVENIDWDTREFRPREFIAQGDKVVVLGDERLVSKPTGRSWHAEWAMVWTVHDGRITLVREFHQTDAIEAAYR